MTTVSLMEVRTYRPESGWPQFWRIFSGPFALALVGLLLAGLGAPEWLPAGWSWGATVFRAGVALIVLGGLWAVAAGFSAPVLRLAAVLTVAGFALMLVNIGRDSQDRREAENYEVAKASLEVAGTFAGTGGVPADALGEERSADQPASVTLAVAEVEAASEHLASAIAAADARQATADAATASAVTIIDAAASVEPEEVDELVRSAAITAALARIDAGVAGAAQAAAEASLSKAQADLARTQVDSLSQAAATEDAATADDSATAAAAAAAAAAASDRAVEAARQAATAAALLPGDDGNGAGLVPEDLAAAAARVRSQERIASTQADLAALEARRAQAASDRAATAMAEAIAAYTGEVIDTVEAVCGDESTSLAVAIECGDELVQGCGENAHDGGRCKPREAQRRLYEGFRTELVAAAAGAQGDQRAALEAEIAAIDENLRALSEPVPVTDLITQGSDDVVTEALRPVTNQDIPSGLASLGWALLAGLAVAAYRWLEVVNGRRRAGPLSLDSGGDDTQKAMFKARFGALRLAEPAVRPGAETLKSANDVVKDQGFQGKVLGFVLSVLQSTAFPPRGVEIEVATRDLPSKKTRAGAADGDADTAQPSSGADVEHLSTKRHEVSLHAYDARTRRLRFAQRYEDDDLETAIDCAAYDVGERVLAGGYTTPGWLRWTPTGGSGLRAYQTALTNDDVDSRALVEQAVARNPGTGVALMALSNELAADGRLVEAAIWAARAIQREPRYLNARYRLGVSLSMIGGNIDAQWTHREHTDELCAVLGLPRHEDPKRILLLRAATELEAARKQLGLDRVLRGLIRQRERDHWLSVLRSRSRRASIVAIEVAEMLVKLRQGDDFDENGIDEKRVEVRNDDADVLYNVACYYSEARRCSEAADALRQARLARRGAGVSLAWVARDPDLQNLVDSAEWGDLRRDLERIDAWGRPGDPEEETR